jgi:O-glycosyl hydrolase
MISVSAQTITVDYTNQQQTIDMIGADMERSASFLQSAANPQEIANWVYSDIDYMTCRVSYDKQQELTEGTTNFDFYDDAIESMKMVKIANPDVKFLATMKSDYDGYGSSSNLPDWIIDYDDNEWFEAEKYAGFLADYLELMEDNGVPVEYLAIAKEWNKYLTVERHVETIAALNDTCAARGITQPKYICPATWSLSQGISFVGTVEDNGYEDYFEAFSSHNLNDEDAKWDDFVDACTDLGKSAYNDESGSAAGGRTSGEEPETLSSILSVYTEKATMYEGGLKGELMFEVWSRGVSAETRTIYFTSGENGERMRSYYVMQKFANNIYERKYISPTTSGFSDVATMAFTNDDEIALWVINSGSTTYSSVDLGLTNTTINGNVYQYAWDIDSKIQGVASQLTSSGSDTYSSEIAAESINLIIFQLTEQGTSDEITLYEDELDFGTIDLEDASTTSQEFSFSVDAQSTDVTLTISGDDEGVFSIDGASSYSSESVIYAEPVTVNFYPISDGEYSATLTITSGSNTETISLIGEAYESETADLPFTDYFSDLVANSSSLTTSDINGYADYKGWQVHNGYSSGADRMHVTHEAGSEDIGYFLSPEINFDGPFELSFYARMRLNNASATLTQTENNAYRNFYAVIGNDTIYDHHAAGSSYFQNYNEWSCTYSYEGTARIKFFAYTENAGDWVDKTDGLTFGPKSDCVSVTSTTSPTINIAYGEEIDLGEVVQGASGENTFTLKGWYLNDGVTFSQDTDNQATISTLAYNPDNNNEIDEEITVTIDASDLELGTYTEKLYLNSDIGDFNERTIWLNYEVTSVTSISTINYVHTVYTQNKTIFIETAYITDIEIYTIEGQRIKQLSNINDASFTLTTGIYLVKIDNEVHKVAITN